MPSDSYNLQKNLSAEFLQKYFAINFVFCFNREENPMNLLNKVLPELKPVLYWMANALEMLHFLQNRLSTYLLPKDEVATSKDALLTADEELLTVLEEVIMFTFQQTVYHLTKVCLSLLLFSILFDTTDLLTVEIILQSFGVAKWSKV